MRDSAGLAPAFPDSAVARREYTRLARDVSGGYQLAFATLPGGVSKMVAQGGPVGIALLAAVAVALLLVERALAPAGPLGWDEGYHALWGLRLAGDLRAGDLLGLLYDSYRQVYWPPGYSWLVAVPLALFGPLTELVRGVGLVALVATSLVAARAGQDLAGPGLAGKVGSLVAAASVLLAGGVLALAPQAMLELPALFWLTLGLWLAARLASAPTARTALALGVVIALTFLTKQNYGVLLGLAVTVSSLGAGAWWRWPPPPGAAAVRRAQLLAAGVLAILLLVWFAYPPKVVQTLQSLRNTPWGPDAASLEGFLFYPRTTLWLAGSWLLLGLWLAALSTALRPAALRDSRILLLLAFVGWQMLFAQLSATKIDRHLLPLVPAGALLLATQIGWLLKRLAPPGRWLALGTLLALGGGHAALVLPAVAPPAVPADRQLTAAVLARLPAGPGLVISTIDLLLPVSSLDWELARTGRLSIDGAGALTYASEQRFTAGTLPRLPEPWRGLLARLATRWPGEQGLATLYLGLPLDAPELELRLASLPERLAAANARRPFPQAVIILPAASPRFPEVTPEAVRAALEAAGYRQTEQEAVAGLTVLQFRR